MEGNKVMCECPCGDCDPDVVFKSGTEGERLAIELYRGCRSCGNYPVFHLYNFDAVGAAEYCEDTPIAPIDMTPSPHGSETVRPVWLDLPTAQDLFQGAAKFDDDQPDFTVIVGDEERVGSIADFIAEYGNDLYAAMMDVYITRVRSDWRKNSEIPK